MTIAFIAPAPLSKTGRVPSQAFLDSVKNRKSPAKDRKLELTTALAALTPMVDNVGPSIVISGKQAKEVTKVAKGMGLLVKVRNYTAEGAEEGSRQVWVKGPVSE